MPRNTIFKVTLGDMSTSEIIRLSGYNYTNSYITDAYFPIAPSPFREEDIEFLAAPDTRKFTEFLGHVAETRPDLVRPTYEHALKFGMLHPDAQRKMANLCFLHEPFNCQNIGKGVIVLYGSPRNRSIGLDWFKYGSESGTLFGFVRKTPALSQTPTP